MRVDILQLYPWGVYLGGGNGPYDEPPARGG
jgi:hypothetical protein